MVDNRNSDDALELMFNATKSQTPVASDDFMARLMTDMETSAPKVDTPQRAAPRPWFKEVKAWFAASGLTGAAIMGMWVGFVMPDFVNTFAVSEDVALYTFLPGADLTTSVLGE